jgi:prophage antirepressor-like protein
MSAPFAFREWNYKGQIVRTVVDDDGGVHVGLGDIHRVLEPDDYAQTPSGLDGHEREPLVVHPCQMILVGVSGIKALLRDSRGPEAELLLKWLESVVMPALHGPDRHGKRSKTPDPNLSGLKALTELRAAQVARNRLDEVEDDDDGDKLKAIDPATLAGARKQAIRTSSRTTAALGDYQDEPAPRHPRLTGQQKLMALQGCSLGRDRPKS